MANALKGRRVSPGNPTRMVGLEDTGGELNSVGRTHQITKEEDEMWVRAESRREQGAAGDGRKTSGMRLPCLVGD